MNSQETHATSGLSRRSVLRAGAHAAWVVPVVTVATASPAFASTVGAAQGKLDITGYSVSRTGRSITGTVTIANTGTASVSGVQVTVSLTPDTAGSPAADTQSSGWTVSRSGSTFTYTYGGSLAAGTSITLNFTVRAAPSGTNSGPSTASVKSTSDAAAGTDSEIATVP